jgi:hypothetical protein
MSETMRNQIRLFVLVILAFLPAVGLYLYANTILREHELRQSQQELVQFAHVAAVEYQRLIDESQQLLGALAEFPEVRDAVAPECNRRLASVLTHTPQYTTLTLVGLDGYLACGALTVDGGLYLGDRTYFTRANATTRFSVGDFVVGRITGRPTLGVAYPILEDGSRDVQSVLAASIDLSTLGDHALQMRMPESATFTVVDSDGTILVREPSGMHPLGHDDVGAEAQPTFMALTNSVSETAMESGIDLDGLRRLFAISPLRGTGATPEGYLLIGKEEMVLMDQAEAVVAQEFRFLVSAGFVLMVMAWLFGHYALIRTTSMGWVESESD